MRENPGERKFENEHIPSTDTEGRLHDLQAGCRINTFNLGTELAQQSAVGRSSSQPQCNDTGSESRRSSAGCLDSE